MIGCQHLKLFGHLKQTVLAGKGESIDRLPGQCMVPCQDLKRGVVSVLCILFEVGSHTKQGTCGVKDNALVQLESKHE